MSAIKPSINDILCLRKMPIISEKSCEMDAFVMGTRKRGRLLLGKNFNNFSRRKEEGH